MSASYMMPTLLFRPATVIRAALAGGAATSLYFRGSLAPMTELKPSAVELA